MYSVLRRVRKDGEPSAWKPEEIEEGRQVIVGAEQVTWKRRSWRRDDEVNLDRARRPGWANGPERKPM